MEETSLCGMGHFGDDGFNSSSMLIFPFQHLSSTFTTTTTSLASLLTRPVVFAQRLQTSMAPLAPLSAPEARSRLKGNLAGFALVCFARTLFTPYLALRAVLVSAIDSLASSPRTARGGDYLWWIGKSYSSLY